MSAPRGHLHRLNASFSMLCIAASVVFIACAYLSDAEWLATAAQVAIGLAIGSVLVGIVAGGRRRRNDSERK